MDLFEIAKDIEFNAKAEAQAVLDYTALLKSLDENNVDEKVIDIIQEIVSDELNHQEKLRQLYIYITGIESNKD